jgi:cytochrome c oxidase assembly protein subunit 15
MIRLKSIGFSFQTRRDRVIVWMGMISLVLILIQIFLGTSVREEVDAIGKSQLLSSSDWIEELSVIFKIHRSFSIAVLAVVGTYALKLISTRVISTWPRVLLALILLEILVGMGLAYLEMPAALQPVHLMFAVFDFALILGLLLIYLRKTTNKSLA